jgi:hypothetical protein
MGESRRLASTLQRAMSIDPLTKSAPLPRNQLMRICESA